MLKREKVCNIIRFISGALVVASVMSLAADMVHSILSSGMPVLRLYLTALYALVPYILCHLTVDRIKSLPLYVLINAIPVIAIAVFPIPTILKAILIIFSGLLIAFAASASMSGNRDFTQQPGPAVLILFVVVYLISGSFSPEMMRACERVDIPSS